MRRSSSIALLVASLAGGAAVAQQAALPNDLADVVALLQPAQRAMLQSHARLWSTWSADRRAAFAVRAEAWERMPVIERGERRADWQAWRQLSAEEQARVRAAAAQYATMDATAQQALRAEFDALDTSERHGWRLGPVLGVDYPRLQPLLAQVPVDEHGALVRTLRAMTPEERDRLAVVVQRTPPSAREALRRELVSTSDANRAAWLMLRLER